LKFDAKNFFFQFAMLMESDAEIGTLSRVQNRHNEEKGGKREKKKKTKGNQRSESQLVVDCRPFLDLRRDRLGDVFGGEKGRVPQRDVLKALGDAMVARVDKRAF